MAYNETTDLPAVYNGSYGVTVTYNNTADLPVVYKGSYVLLRHGDIQLPHGRV